MKRKAKSKKGRSASELAARAKARTKRRSRPRRRGRHGGGEEDVMPEITYARVVLWGGGRGTVNFGGAADRQREGILRRQVIAERAYDVYAEAMKAYLPAAEAMGRALGQACLGAARAGERMGETLRTAITDMTQFPGVYREG